MRKTLKKFYNRKKVLITGVTGFKGTWLCSWLLELGANITGIGYNPNLNKNLFYKLKLNNKINLKLFDIRDISKLNSLVKKSKPSIIFHLAAQPLIYESYKKPLETFDINSRGTLNILEIGLVYSSSLFTRSFSSLSLTPIRASLEQLAVQ